MLNRRFHDPGPAFSRETRFEAERVEMVIEAFRLDAFRAAVYDAGEARTGLRALTFGGLAAVLPTFPVRLAAQYVEGTSGMRPAWLFRALTYGKLLDLYLTEREGLCAGRRGRPPAPDDPRPVGLVVPLDGYAGGFVLHDAEVPAGTTGWSSGYGDGPPHRLTFQPFRDFLDHLATIGWVAGGAADCPPAGPPPAVGRVSFGALGPMLGPGVAVFLWVVRALRSASPADRRHVCRVDADTLGVAGPDEVVGRETGLTARQVRRALGGLRAAGLVGQHRQPGGARAVTVTPAGWAAADALADSLRPDPGGPASHRS